jgi:lantibiotic biosynthesis protein
MIAAFEFSPALALEVATGIGYGIARRALWHEDRCTWFDGTPVMPTESPKSMTLGSDVYAGASGVGLVLAQLAARTGETTLRETARGAVRQALAALDAPGSELGFYGGKAGAATALVLAGRELADDEPVERGRAMLCELALTPQDPDQNDIVSGTAGSLVALVVASAVLGDADLLDRAREAARVLIGLGHRNDDGSLSWSTMADKLADLCGFAHGASGNAYALLALYAVERDPVLREAIDGALAYERARFSHEYGNWPDYRWFGTGPREPSYPVSWCHGAVGIVRTRLLAEALGFDVGAEIDIALDTAEQQVWRQLSDPAGDRTLCHGLFGSLDALVDGARSGRRAYATVVARCAGAAAERHHFGDAPWPSGLLSHEPIDGLMMGHAGIAHVYLRLADPSVRALLAPA